MGSCFREDPGTALAIVAQDAASVANRIPAEPSQTELSSDAVIANPLADRMARRARNFSSYCVRVRQARNGNQNIHNALERGRLACHYPTDE